MLWIKRGGNSLTALVSGLPWTDQLGPIVRGLDSHGKSRDINGTPPLPWRAHTSTVFLVLPHTTRRREATVALLWDGAKRHCMASLPGL